jgi:hypothetical protein
VECNTKSHSSSTPVLPFNPNLIQKDDLAVPVASSEDEADDISSTSGDIDATWQPVGRYCLNLCRLSSNKYPKGTPKAQIKAAQEEELDRRRHEGETIAHRIESNAPTEFLFARVQSVAQKKPSTDATNWAKTEGRISNLQKEIVKFLTALPRAPKKPSIDATNWAKADGSTIDIPSASSGMTGQEPKARPHGRKRRRKSESQGRIQAT